MWDMVIEGTGGVSMVTVDTYAPATSGGIVTRCAIRGWNKPKLRKITICQRFKKFRGFTQVEPENLNFSLG